MVSKWWNDPFKDFNSFDRNWNWGLYIWRICQQWWSGLQKADNDRSSKNTFCSHYPFTTEANCWPFCIIGIFPGLGKWRKENLLSKVKSFICVFHSVLCDLLVGCVEFKEMHWAAVKILMRPDNSHGDIHWTLAVRKLVLRYPPVTLLDLGRTSPTLPRCG